MLRPVITVLLVAAAAGSGYAVLQARKQTCSASGTSCKATARSSNTSAGNAECAPKAATALATPPRGRVLGNFDPGQAASCRFACATKQPYRKSDLTAQPGVRTGQLTQCPVSGVVFTADKQRPTSEWAPAPA